MLRGRLERQMYVFRDIAYRGLFPFAKIHDNRNAASVPKDFEDAFEFLCCHAHMIPLFAYSRELENRENRLLRAAHERERYVARAFRRRVGVEENAALVRLGKMLLGAAS